MAVGDLYELVTTQTFLGQVCKNVYFYAVSAQDADPTLPALRLADAWNALNWEDADSIFRSTLISDGVRYISINVRNLFVPAIVSELLLGTHTGGNAGDDLPPFNAYALRSERFSGAVRRVFKRFVGVAEAAQVAGELIPSAVTQLNLLGDQLVTELTYTGLEGSLTFSPVGVKRIPYVTPEGRDAYRLPETALEAVYGQFFTLLAQPNVTSQNSRKFGVGA